MHDFLNTILNFFTNDSFMSYVGDPVSSTTETELLIAFLFMSFMISIFGLCYYIVTKLANDEIKKRPK